MTGLRIVDVSGRPIPADARYASDLPATLATPPSYQTPDFTAQEFLYTAFGTLAAASAAFVPLTDVATGLPFAATIDKGLQGRIAGITVQCPDAGAAVAPYLTVRVTVNAQPAPGWGNIVLEPFIGTIRKAFEANLLLQPGALLGLSVMNADVALSHYVQVSLFGWTWAGT